MTNVTCARRTPREPGPRRPAGRRSVRRALPHVTFGRLVGLRSRKRKGMTVCLAVPDLPLNDLLAASMTSANGAAFSLTSSPYKIYTQIK